MIRIWPRKPHEVQTSTKRRTDENDVTNSNGSASPVTSSQSSRAHRYTKGGSLDSRYSGNDVTKSYPHLVYSQPGLVIPYVTATADSGSRQRSQQQQQLQPPPLPPQQQQQQQQSSSHKGLHFS